MAIIIDEQRRIFTLQTKYSTYQIKADAQDVLLHMYYGEKTDNSDKSLLFSRADRGFSGNPYEMGKRDRTYSMDSLPQEYSTFGTGDYRITSLRVQNKDGSQAAELRYVGYRVQEGKYAIPKLPAVYAKNNEAKTLVIQLADSGSGLEVELYYGILEELDIITRAVKITNQGTDNVVIQKAASINLDWEYGDFEWMKFGIWLESEGISEDSDLYRNHPEWVVGVPGRKPCLSRCQWILDFSREDVQDYIIERISELFDGIPVSYVKWDCNRAICDKFSGMLDGSRQGEFAHRYVLGLYRVLEELTEKFPEILFESCGGGGGRFDVGMLYYMPQIWGSDTTDAIERLSIQYGASFGYPISAMGTHVSTAPNHQTGRVVPLSTRECVAMAGTFGYELDISKLTQEEKEEVKEQIDRFKKYYDLIQYGDYYKISSPLEGTCTVWEIADPSGTEALVSVVYHHVQANPIPVRVKVQGLKEEASYQLFLNENFKEKYPKRLLPYGFSSGETISSAA